MTAAPCTDCAALGRAACPEHWWELFDSPEFLAEYRRIETELAAADAKRDRTLAFAALAAPALRAARTHLAQLAEWPDAARVLSEIDAALALLEGDDGR